MSFTAFAQDAHFTQFFAAASHLNPAFAGATFQNRAAINYRNQWPGIPKAFVSYNMAVDMNFDKVNTGAGLMVFRDNAGTGGLNTTQVALQVSHQFKVDRDLYIRPALQYGWIQRSLNINQLTFGDQLIRDNAPTSVEQSQITPVNNFDFATGCLVYSSLMWGGISIHHLNQPNESLLGEESQLPIKFSLHGGYKLYVDRITRTSTDEEINFAFNYKAQKKFDQFDIGLYYVRNPMIFGIWYRGIPLFKAYEAGYQNNDAIALLIGTEFKDIKIGYSYDITISRLATNTAGAHEISIIYQWMGKDAPPLSKQKRVVPCPKF